MAALNIKGSASRDAGLDLTVALDAAAAGGDTIPAGDNIYLRVKNGQASAVTVSAIAPSANAGPDGTFLATKALSPQVGASTGDRLYGPFPASTYADPSDGRVHITYSSSTSVTVGVYQMSNR